MAAAIPLECKICPKKPDFSDVSHLLMHVASKAHLSRYYQMKVKGSADDQSRRLVDDYDDWYERYSIDDLMRDRLNQKDKRGGGGRNNTTAVATRRGSGATASSRGTPAAAASQNGRRGPRPLRDSVLNPQLDARVKTEPMSRSGTPLSSLTSIETAMFLGSRYAPPSWPNTPYAGSPMKQETLSSSRSDDDDSFVLEAEYLPQRTMGGRGGRHNNIAGTGESLNIYDDWEDTVGETTSDVAKLKGLVWPGMAMFDSATPDMRRKRNQKKDYSVIEQLQATSEWVEPNEMVFDATGVLRRERMITGNPDVEDDDSLLSGEAEPEPEVQLPKKRLARKPRQALVEKNRNTGRVTRRRTGGSHHPGGSHHTGGFGKSRAPYYDGAAGDDDDLTFGNQRPKKRAGLSIHRDNTGPEITFERPTPLNYLTSGFRNPFQAAQNNNTHPLPPLFAHPNSNPGHQRLPSFGFGGSAFGNNFSSNFRPTTTGGNPMQDFASFGGLNNHTLFQHNPYPPSNGAAAMAAFQQQFGLGPQQQQPFELGMPPAANNVVDHGFPGNTELNPLFFSSNQPTPPQDDEGTVSPPNSERER
ncbi:hypothetical protein LTR59_001625 [Friedmanniomyces endolithicus]|nr:hypothetical protein LTR59_001625 [Friedmanniomyces endolithicus]KAK0819270.1 hypothetical protein LTR38_000713 [Friedmanniomyces endolithicus]